MFWWYGAATICGPWIREYWNPRVFPTARPWTGRSSSGTSHYESVNDEENLTTGPIYIDDPSGNVEQYKTIAEIEEALSDVETDELIPETTEEESAPPIPPKKIITQDDMETGLVYWSDNDNINPDEKGRSQLEDAPGDEKVEWVKQKTNELWRNLQATQEETQKSIKEYDKKHPEPKQKQVRRRAVLPTKRKKENEEKQEQQHQTKMLKYV